MEDNEQEGQLNIARFLETFNQGPILPNPAAAIRSPESVSDLPKPVQYSQSFERLEEKIQELEEKFAASTAQNEAVLEELARTRKAVESQKGKDAFLASLASSIANLKASVETLSQRAKAPLYDPAPAPARDFDTPSANVNDYTTAYYASDNSRAIEQAKLQAALTQLHAERLEKEQARANWKAARAEKQQLLSSMESEREAHEQSLQHLRAEKELAQAGWNAALSEKEKMAVSLQDEKEQAVASVLNEKKEMEDSFSQERSKWQEERAGWAAEQSAWKEEQTAREAELNALHTETTEKSRIIASLQQKASQLKAVNTALDREIKRVHQERTEALRKSAEQAKEILSLRDALTAAEERFKSFNFEGRIISIKREYEQKVSHLETKLQEVSATCMKQVEEIESLKTENIQLHKLAEEREQLAALYDKKTKELQVLRQSVQQLRSATETVNSPRLAAFTQRMNRLQEEHKVLSEQLVQSKQALQNVTQEKEVLERNFKSLRKKMEENDSVIASLKDQINFLTQENAVLKKQPAQSEKPVPVPVGVPVKQPKRRLEAKAAAAKPIPPSAPVEVQNTVHAAIETADDLPEIRVAKPMPKEEMYHGEDFLERTDSFIGRMKWSIFREDK